MSFTLFRWSLTVALAGFLFGFDTVVISGADLALQDLWPRGELFHGVVIISSALWGTVLGAMFGGIPTDKLGRKTTLFWIGVLYTISALGSALAGDPWVFAVFRFIGGLGVGASTVAAPTYVAEISPAADRGKLVGLYQFNIVFGILIAFVSNYQLAAIETDAWRWMVGVEAIPAVIYTVLVLTVPRSPRWLALVGREREALEVLERIDSASSRARAGALDGGAISPAARLATIRSEEAGAGGSRRESIFDPKYRFPLLMAFLIAFFNQFSGINAFLYYAPRIFELAGLAADAALLSSVGIGVTNLVFTIIGLSMIDRFGRRTLLYIGSVGYIVSLAGVALAFQLSWEGMAVPGFLFLFIASHAVGQGAIIWVFISEMFPNHLRGSGQAFGTSVHWVLAAVIPSLVPVLFTTVGTAPVFWFFAFMMFLQLLFTWRLMPETRGVPLEELEARLQR